MLKCKRCGKEYYRKPCERERSKYCSRVCQNKMIGIGVNRSKYMTKEVRNKISKSKTGITIWNGKRLGMTWMHADRNSNWKGENVGYDALHDWVNREKGKASKCEWCGSFGKSKGCHWANISKEYKRDINDYISLCPKCHKNYDMKGIWRNICI